MKALLRRAQLRSHSRLQANTSSAKSSEEGNMTDKCKFFGFCEEQDRLKSDDPKCKHKSINRLLKRKYGKSRVRVGVVTNRDLTAATAAGMYACATDSWDKSEVTPTLTEMTEKAVAMLGNYKEFFLMVESGL